MNISSHNDANQERLDGLDDMDLVAAYRSGESRAGESLFKRYRGDVALVARALAPDLTKAEDFANEAFLRMFQAVRNGYGPTSNVRAYLRASVRNQANSWYRDPENRVTVGYEEGVLEGLVDESIEDTGSFESEIVVAFRELPSRWQKILFMRTIEGRKSAEVSQLLNLSTGAERVLYARAREGLRYEYLFQISRGLIQSHCSHIARDVVNEVVNKGTKGRRRQLRAHLAVCESCRMTFIELNEIASAFNYQHAARLLGSCAVPLALLAPAGISAGSSYGGIKLLANWVSTRLPVVLTTLTATAIVGAAIVSVLAVESSAELEPTLSLTTEDGKCAVSLSTTDHDRNGLRGVFLTRAAEGSSCELTIERDGRMIFENIPIPNQHSFAATTPGEYLVTIQSESQLIQREFTIR